jgi:hypothetical protein
MENWISALGTGASVIVAVSLTLRNVKRLRQINLAGSLAFAAYGWLIGAWPVFGLNVFIVAVNAWYLAKGRLDAAKAETFETWFVDAADPYLRRFLGHYADDIRRFFPGFDPDPLAGTLAGASVAFVLRQTLPVALIAFRRAADGGAAVLLDYAIPDYRDYKSARFFFGVAVRKIAAPGAVLTARAAGKVHAAYLRRVGFRPDPSEAGLYRLILPSS